MAIPYVKPKWVFRKVGMDFPEYRTYMEWYWRKNSDLSKAGTNCPKCKGFVPDNALSFGLQDSQSAYYSIVNHECGARLSFLREGTEL